VVGIPEGENFEDVLAIFIQYMNVTDRQTDRQTDRDTHTQTERQTRHRAVV